MMLKATKRLLSMALAIVMLLSLLPVGTIAIAAGENDATLSTLSYTFNNQAYTIALAADNVNATLQETHYSVTLPFITKNYSSDRMPQVTATSSISGANVSIAQITSFPNTAKITVTSDSTASKNYYVRFKYAPGNISAVSNKLNTSKTYIGLHDMQPMSLTELRELYADEGNNWVNYAQCYVDRYITGFKDTGTDTYKLPSSAAAYTGTGEYISDFNGSKWFTMWIAKGAGSNGDTSSMFNGASWIATGNDEKSSANMVASIPDAVTFTIDRGATVWLASRNSTIANLQANDWVKAASGTKLLNGDNASFTNMYTKHFNAGVVQIPSQGVSIDRMYVPIILWDAPGTGNTNLSSLTATYGGVDHNIPIVPNQTTYDIAVSSIPQIRAVLADQTAEADIAQTQGVPGAATLTVVSGSNTKVYTINYVLKDQHIIYADKTDTTGVTGMTYVKNGSTYPMVPAATDFSTSSPINAANAGTCFWDFNDGSGPVNITRSYSNYGGAVTQIRNEGRGTGSSFSVYVKMDLSSLDPSQSVQQALLSLGLTGGSTMAYSGLNKNLYVDVYEVPETKWISGTGTADAAWTDKAPNKVIRADFAPFPYVNAGGTVVAGDVSQPHPLTWAAAPNNTQSVISDIAGMAYAKRLTTVYVGQAEANKDLGTVTVDVAQSVRDKLNDGKTTATFMLSIAKDVYGYAVAPDSKNDMYLNVASTGVTRPKLTVTCADSGSYASSENKLAYIALGDKDYYTSGNRTYTAGKTPMDLAGGFDDLVTSEQNFNLQLEDLTGGKVGLNAVTKDANAMVSINGAEATKGGQYSLVAPTSGVATAQVAVTAQSGEILTYNLKFTITDYQMSSDSSLSKLSYTHRELGTKDIDLTAGVTSYEVELPYSLANEVPQISGVANNSYAVISSTVQAAAVPGSATITIKAENGTQTTYTLYFARSNTPSSPGVGTVSNLKYRGAEASGDFKAVTGLQATETVDIFNDNTNYPTQADKIAAANNPTINLYKNDDLRVYSDRVPSTGGGNGSTSSSALGSQVEFAYVVKGEAATSPEFISPNVTRILTKNDEKTKTDSIPDAYGFTIDKPATVYIAWGSNEAPSANISSHGWTLDNTGLKITRTGVGIMQFTEGLAADGKYYAIPNGTTNSYTGIYTKHYAAGANVEIPSTGGGGSGLVVLMIWDTVEKQAITSLTLNASNNLRQTEGATETVTFRAIATPSVDVDRSAIEWYVNGVKQSTAGANFSYKPMAIGEYVVLAKVAGNESAVVESKTIVVTSALRAGDVNGDGDIDISDVIMTAEIAVGTPGYLADQILRANVNSKTEMTVDISDVVLIAERAVGGTAPFPVD